MSEGDSSENVSIEQITDQASIATDPSITSSPTSSLQSLSLTNSTDERNPKLKIVLDSPTNTYYSGDTIRGTISLFAKQKKKIRGIYYRLIGYGKCNWTDWLRRESVTVDGKGERSFVQYSGTEEYVNTTMYIVGSKNGPTFTLSQGITTYNFCFNLKSNLPSSFIGGHGKIKFKLEIVVDRKWKFDEKQTILLNIIQQVNLNFEFTTLNPFENQLTRNIGYISSGPISLHVFIAKTGVTPGEKLPVQVILSNNSRIHVDKLKFTFNRIVDYHSKTPGIAIKREVHRLLKKEAGGVAKKTEQRYEHVIEVPITTPSQGILISRLIHISYELKVEAKLGGLYKNLLIAIPVTVGTIPHSIHGRTINHLFPSLPDLPIGLTVRTPSTLENDLDMRRSSFISNSSYRSNVSHNSSNNQPSMQIDDRRSINANPYVSTGNDTITSIDSNRFSSIPSSPSSVLSSEYRPTAPPMDHSATNTSRSSNVNVYADAPPSYNEVFGSSAHSSSSIQMQPNHSASTPKI